MPTVTQQKAKDMSKFWQEGQAKLSQPKSSDFNQNYVDNRSNQAQFQQGANDQYLYDRQLKDMRLWAQNSQSIKTNEGRIGREQQVADKNFTYQQDFYNRGKQYEFQKEQASADRTAASNQLKLQLGDNTAQRASDEKKAQLQAESSLYQQFTNPSQYNYRYW